MNIKDDLGKVVGTISNGTVKTGNTDLREYVKQISDLGGVPLKTVPTTKSDGTIVENVIIVEPGDKRFLSALQEFLEPAGFSVV